MLPSHNCIIVNNVQFSRYIFELPKKFNEVSRLQGTSVNLLIINCQLLIVNWKEVVGQNGLEPSTSRLSVVCSSQLSYWPVTTSFFGGD